MLSSLRVDGYSCPGVQDLVQLLLLYLTLFLEFHALG